MISITTKMTDLPVLAAMSGVSGISGVSAAGIRVLGAGLPSAAPLPAMSAAPVMRVMREVGERRSQAPAAVVAGQDYAFAAANGAGSQHTQHTWKWAFRGLEPWSDPA